MSERREIERLVRELHTARVEGRLEAVCALFAPDANFKIAGARGGKPINLCAQGAVDIHRWLSMMVRTFRLSGYELLSLVIEDGQAAAYWRVDIHSKITGVLVPTELVDLIEVRAGRIASYTELFVPC
jgi:ketosteroid isomerase-like protein